MKPYISLLPYIVIAILVAVGARYSFARYWELKQELRRTRNKLAEQQAEHQLKLRRLTAELLKAQRQALACELERDKE